MISFSRVSSPGSYRSSLRTRRSKSALEAAQPQEGTEGYTLARWATVRNHDKVIF